MRAPGGDSAPPYSRVGAHCVLQAHGGSRRFCCSGAQAPPVEIPLSVVGREQWGPASPAPAHADGIAGCSRGNVDRVQIKPVTTLQYAGDFPSTRGKTDCEFSQYFNHLFSVPREILQKQNKTKQTLPKSKKNTTQTNPNPAIPQEKAGY